MSFRKLTPAEKADRIKVLRYALSDTKDGNIYRQLTAELAELESEDE